MPAEQESKIYQAFLFRQRQSSPLQVAFVASSAEIDSWARVPTKQTGNVRNFQRAEIGSHIKEVQKFFQDKENASPTAVVVGFDPIRSIARVTVRDSTGESIAEDQVTPGQVLQGTIEVRWPKDDDPRGREATIESIAERLPTIRGFVILTDS